MIVICPCCTKSFKLEIPEANRRQVEQAVIDYIINSVLTHFNVTEKEVYGHRRDSEFVMARHAAIYLVWKYSGWSKKRVGKLFKRDHTTVIYAIRRCFNSYSTNTDLHPHLCRLSLDIESMVETSAVETTNHLAIAS